MSKQNADNAEVTATNTSELDTLLGKLSSSGRKSYNYVMLPWDVPEAKVKYLADRIKSGAQSRGSIYDMLTLCRYSPRDIGNAFKKYLEDHRPQHVHSGRSSMRAKLEDGSAPFYRAEDGKWLNTDVQRLLS